MSIYMNNLDYLLERNKIWATSVNESDPEFFTKLTGQQSPEYLWIGCSDSRVPANQIVSLPPGEVFVHRNIANMVVHSDLNCLSVIQYAVEVLKIKHIIVCGHYDCGGVSAALEHHEHGLIDNWLNHVKDIKRFHREKFHDLNHNQKLDLLCELNVKEQVRNVCTTSIIQDAWKDGKELSVHGWIYNIKNGILQDLDISLSSKQQLIQKSSENQ